jgi:hypothetical protein
MAVEETTAQSVPNNVVPLKKQKKLPQLVLGTLRGDPNDIMIEYAQDVNHLGELRTVLTSLVFQQRALQREIEEIRVSVAAHCVETYGLDKAKWGNEQVRKATLDAELANYADYQAALQAGDKLDRELADTKDEIAFYEDSQQARRAWSRMYVIQGLMATGTTGEGLDL